MENHEDAYIITDIKSENIKGLNKIAIKYQGLKERFIPQIYKFEEYDIVKGMGFKNIILTLYAADYSNEKVLDFLKEHKVSALTIWYYRASKDFIDRLKGLEVIVYVHTVNDLILRDKLKGIGVDGFYTDFIKP
jgi:glycerophosphoryl diester phosphodiesterase